MFENLKFFVKLNCWAFKEGDSHGNANVKWTLRRTLFKINRHCILLLCKNIKVGLTFFSETLKFHIFNKYGLDDIWGVYAPCQTEAFSMDISWLKNENDDCSISVFSLVIEFFKSLNIYSRGWSKFSSYFVVLQLLCYAASRNEDSCVVVRDSRVIWWCADCEEHNVLENKCNERTNA